MKQTKLTKAARGRECQVRIPGVCNGNPETVVLAHYRLAGTCGVGQKPSDLQGATTEIYTLSLHDALPICKARGAAAHATTCATAAAKRWTARRRASTTPRA